MAFSKRLVELAGVEPASEKLSFCQAFMADLGEAVSHFNCMWDTNCDTFKTK